MRKTLQGEGEPVNRTSSFSCQQQANAIENPAKPNEKGGDVSNDDQVLLETDHRSHMKAGQSLNDVHREERSEIKETGGDTPSNFPIMILSGEMIDDTISNESTPGLDNTTESEPGTAVGLVLAQGHWPGIRTVNQEQSPCSTLYDVNADSDMITIQEPSGSVQAQLHSTEQEIKQSIVRGLSNRAAPQDRGEDPLFLPKSSYLNPDRRQNTGMEGRRALAELAAEVALQKLKYRGNQNETVGFSPHSPEATL
jgi:hypothetical protein